MTDNESTRSTTSRIVTAAFGLLLLGCAFAIFPFNEGEADFVMIAAALVIGALGLEAVLSALLDRPSLLSRIGPLP